MYNNIYIRSNRRCCRVCIYERHIIIYALYNGLFELPNIELEVVFYMPRGKKKKVEEFDAGKMLEGILRGDRLDDDERYRKSVDNIYKKLRPIWLQECKDAVWLLQDDYIKEVARILYLDDQMGGNLDPESLSEDKRNLLGWKQVQSVIERYRALDYSLVDSESIKAILSSIIKNKQARDADRLKAIEMYTGMYSGEGIEGITFVNDLSTPKKIKKDDEEE